MKMFAATPARVQVMAFFGVAIFGEISKLLGGVKLASLRGI